MKAGRNTLYWTSTVLVAAAFVSAGTANLLRAEGIVRDVTALGYPAYFMGLLGLGKLLGGLAILVPRLPRLKEWAYAGIGITVVCAAYSHLMSGDSAAKVAAPLVVGTLAALSWALRPASRVLGVDSSASLASRQSRATEHVAPA